MLGGGIFVTQNKKLPGSYINIVSASSVNSSILGERGVVAIALPLNFKANTVIELSKIDFVTNSKDLIGVDYEDASIIHLREIFRHATKVYIYDLGETGAVADAVKALEPYEFNVLCAYTGDADAIETYIEAVKSWRDEYGKKCQVVVYNTPNCDSEGVINVVSKVSNEGALEYALTAWVAGAEAGCRANESCTNMVYDGEYTIICDKTQKELEDCLTNGEIVFHLVYQKVRLLEDINSLTTTTLEKGEVFKSNQTIRVIDQIANDIAKLFNTKYLGKIPNNKSGRISLWGDIVSHHKELESIQAIENFNSDLLTVEQGINKKSVVVNDVITVVNAMAQLYMTIEVQ